MGEAAGLLVSGVVVGSQYALFVAGLALLFGAMRILNFAHGVLFIAGGYALFHLTSAAELNVFVAVLVAGVGGGLIAGVVLEVGLLLPLRERSEDDHVVVALATVGFATAVIAAVEVFVGSEPKSLSTARGIVTTLGSIPIRGTALFSIIAAAVLLGALAWVLKRTQIGLRIRAVADAPHDAELVGVDSGQMIRWTVLASAMMASVAGALYAAHVGNVSPYIGDILMVKGIALIVVGGMGSLGGAVLIAFVVGLGESFAVGYLGSSWREAVALALLLIILLWRPHGLFGRSELSRL